MLPFRRSSNNNFSPDGQQDLWSRHPVPPPRTGPSSANRGACGLHSAVFLHREIHVGRLRHGAWEIPRRRSHKRDLVRTTSVFWTERHSLVPATLKAVGDPPEGEKMIFPFFTRLVGTYRKRSPTGSFGGPEGKEGLRAFEGPKGSTRSTARPF